MIKIREKIISELIISGLILFGIFIIVTKIIYNIPTSNNIAGAIGLLTWIPIFSGLFLYARRIKQKKPKVATILLFISITFISSSCLTSILIFIESIA